MPKDPVVLLPRLQQLLTQMGENIRLARLRRKLSAARVAERAAISRNTLHAIEQGDRDVLEQELVHHFRNINHTLERVVNDEAFKTVFQVNE